MWGGPPAGTVVFSRGALPALVAPPRERGWGKECPDHSLPTYHLLLVPPHWPNSSRSQRTREPIAVV